MARTLTQSWRRTIQYQTLSRRWLEESLECSYFLVKSEIKSPGISCVRFISAQASGPAHAQRGPEGPETRHPAVNLSLMSPGFVSDPYSLSEPISFKQSCFTRSGWKRRKEALISKLKSNSALDKVRRKYGFLEKFHEETANMYQEINTLVAKNIERSLREFVTENMYCALRNEIKDKEKAWVHLHWELIFPFIKIRTLQARLIGTDKKDVMKSFAQITVEFLSEQLEIMFQLVTIILMYRTSCRDNLVPKPTFKFRWAFRATLSYYMSSCFCCMRLKSLQKFEAHDTNGAVVGDKATKVLMRDIWVFERSLFHDESRWRLCGKIKV